MKYGILNRSQNKVVSWYIGDRIAYKFPFGDRISYLHFEVLEEYAEGYSLDELGNLQYDFSYTPPVPTYSVAKEAKLVDIQENFDTIIREFAVENAELLNDEIMRLADLGQLDPTDDVALNAYVRSVLDPLVDALKPILTDVKTHYFYRISEYMALVPREPVLASEERLMKYLTNLMAIIG